MDEKLTIVGPEPTGPYKKNPQKKYNIETLLIMAKYNKKFRKELFENREKTLKESGLSLTGSEKILLMNISNKQLKENINEFRLPGVTKNSHPNWKRAVSVLVLVSTLLSTSLSFMCQTSKGIEPDEENVILPVNDPDDYVTKGIVPDEEFIPEEDEEGNDDNTQPENEEED